MRERERACGEREERVRESVRESEREGHRDIEK